MEVTMLDNGPGESYGMGSGPVAQCCSYGVNTRRCVKSQKETAMGQQRYLYIS